MGDIEGAVIVRGISKGFVFGFQGCMSADEIRLRVSTLRGVPFADISLLPLLGLPLARQSVFEITVVVSQTSPLTGKGKGKVKPFLTDWPGDPRQ